MRFLLDTDTLSNIIREPRGPAARRITHHPVGNVITSIIVAGELKFGLLRKAATIQQARLEALLARVPPAPFKAPADQIYAEVRLELERRGSPIGANDMLIAAHALTLDCTLVTANEREFCRVPGLRVENWLG